MPPREHAGWIAVCAISFFLFSTLSFSEELVKLIRRRWARDRVRVALAVALLVLLLGNVVLGIGSSPARLAASKPAYKAPVPTAMSSAVKVEKVRAAYARLPLIFEPNQGQTDLQVKFVARGTGYGLFLTVNESVLALRPGSRRSGRVTGVV